MKTLQVELKKLIFLKTSKEESFDLKQHAKCQLFITNYSPENTDQLFFIKNLNFKGVVFFGNAIFASEIKD